MPVTSPCCWPVMPYWLFSTRKMTGQPCLELVLRGEVAWPRGRCRCWSRRRRRCTGRRGRRSSLLAAMAAPAAMAIRAADDGVGAEMPGVEVGDVHAAAAPAAVALFLAEQLGHGAVEVLLHGAVQHALAVAHVVLGGVLADELGQLRHVALLQREGALGDGVPVAAVGGGDVVIGIDGADGADRDGLLADGQMRRADELVVRQRLELLVLEPDDHLFEEADVQHVVQQLEALLPWSSRRRSPGSCRHDTGRAGWAGR